MILETNEKYYGLLFKLLDKNPQSIQISTYGIYAGIGHDGSDRLDQQPYIKDFLQKAQKHNTTIIVGISPFRPCNRNGCIYCEANFVKGLFRTQQHALKFDKINWRIVKESHYKVILVHGAKNSIIISGNRNLTGSSWTDVSFVLGDEYLPIMQQFFDQDYQRSHEITDKLIEEFLEENKISQKALSLI